MEKGNYLGIHLSKDRATVLCLDTQGRNRNVLGCFSVSVQQKQDQSSLKELASLIAQGCAERDLQFSEVAVALDCTMFMQHNVHSEFSDPKQIASTIRFDTEEALATDISDVAIAFKITSSDHDGSGLTAFTAQHQILSEIILALQSNNIDPVTIEPDVNCLSRFVCQDLSLPDDSHPLFCVLSKSNGYFIAFSKQDKHSTMRTFLIGPTQSKTTLLARELLMTIASIKTAEPINCVKIFDASGSVDNQQLSEKLGVEVAGIDLADPQTLDNCDDTVGFAIAYGAALAHPEKVQTINFRSDFMPYQGKKARLQKTLKFASISVTVLLLALGIYLTPKLLQVNENRSRLRSKFEKDYLTVMLDQKKLPAKPKDAVGKLSSLKRRIENEKKGLITDKQAVSVKLRLVLEAFNKCAKKTGLNINSISIADKTIHIVGDTAPRANRNTLKVFDAIREIGLNISQEILSSQHGRDTFSITVTPEG